MKLTLEFASRAGLKILLTALCQTGDIKAIPSTLLYQISNLPEKIYLQETGFLKESQNI
jgi:hypothetical protein